MSEPIDTSATEKSVMDISTTEQTTDVAVDQTAETSSGENGDAEAVKSDSNTTAAAIATSHIETSALDERDIELSDDPSTANTSRDHPYLSNMLALPNSVLFKVFKAFFRKTRFSNIIISALDEIRKTVTRKIDLFAYLKLLGEKAVELDLKKFPALKDNALKMAKLEMTSPEVWLIKAYNVPIHLGKKKVGEIFEKYGHVLEVYCVGTNHPLDTVEVAMDSFEGCQKAIVALNSKKDPGMPNNVHNVANRTQIPVKDKQVVNENYQKEWIALNDSLSSVVDFISDYKKAELFDVMIEKKQTSPDLTRKEIVRIVLKDFCMCIRDDSLELEDWKDDADFVTMVKRQNAVNKLIWVSKPILAQCSHVTIQLLQQHYEERHDKGEDMSHKSVFKSVFYALPEVNIFVHARAEFELPDVSVKWILLQQLPQTVTEEELKSFMDGKGEVERIIMLNKNTSRVCAVIKCATPTAVRTICKHFRTESLPGATDKVKIMRYTGKLAAKTHDYNKEDYLDTKAGRRKAKKRTQSDGTPAPPGEESTNTKQPANKKKKKNSQQQNNPNQPMMKQNNPTFTPPGGSNVGRFSAGAGNRKQTPAGPQQNQMQQQRQSRELDLIHLPPGTTEDQVRVSMSEFGVVVNVEISKSGKSCVVCMKNPQQANRAVKSYNSRMLPGCTIPMTASIRSPGSGLNSTNQMLRQGTNQMTGQGANQMKGQGANQMKGQGANEMKGQGANQMKGQRANQMKGHGTNQMKGHGRSMFQGNKQMTMSPNKRPLVGGSMQYSGSGGRYQQHDDRRSAPIPQRPYHSNGYSGNGYSSNSYSGNGYSSNGYSGNGSQGQQSYNKYDGGGQDNPRGQSRSFYRDSTPEMEFSPMNHHRDTNRRTTSNRKTTPKDTDNMDTDQMKNMLLAVSSMMAKNLKLQKGIKQQNMNPLEQRYQQMGAGNQGQQNGSVAALQKQVADLKQQQEQLQNMLQKQLQQNTPAAATMLPPGDASYNYQDFSPLSRQAYSLDGYATGGLLGGYAMGGRTDGQDYSTGDQDYQSAYSYDGQSYYHR